MRGVFLKLSIMIGIAVGGYLFSRFLSHTLPTLALPWTCILVFSAVKIGGDILLAPFRPYFYDNFFLELAQFAVLGLLAAVVIYLSEKYIGGQVDPAIPAVAAFILWSWRRTDGIRFRTGGKL